MRIFYILVVLLLFFCSCHNSKPKEESKKVLSEAEKLEKTYKRINEDLSYENEKIILLSEIRKMPFDTLIFILRDYYVITDTVSSSDINSKYLYQSSIAKISERYKISKSRIASLIFSYKYEMLTKEEIEESAIENFRDNNEEETPEPEDQY